MINAGLAIGAWLLAHTMKNLFVTIDVRVVGTSRLQCQVECENMKEFF